MTPGEVRRPHFIIRTLLGYRLDKLIPKMCITLSLRLWRYSLFWMPNRHKDKPLGERLRLVLQELGPVWTRLERVLPTHRDLFPPHITDQLALLQGKVAPFDDRLAKQQIEAAVGDLPVKAWFDDFGIKPLASASIAQVHTAQLRSNGKEVVIKVICPDILPVIKADLKLIYRLVRWVPRLLPDSRRLRPAEVVREYEKTLVDEPNLLRESANAIQLRCGFEGSPVLYIPEVYPDCCSKKVMAMEHIYGIPVSDVATLEKNGTNMKLLAKRGVQMFFTQVFRDSFFHADMHPDNIFVSYEHPENPKYIGIDCGIIGSLNEEDRRYLAENFIAFFNRDYREVTGLHVDSGWVSPDTNVEEFEFAIRTVYKPIFEKPLAETSFGHVLLSLFNTTRHFNTEMQPQLVLFQKTPLYVEGVGRQLYPQLDLWRTAKSFLESWIKGQVDTLALVRAFKGKAPLWIEKVPELSKPIYDSLRQGKYLQHSVDKAARELQSNHVRRGQSRYFPGIGTTLVLSGIFLSVSRPEWGLIPGWLMASGLIAQFVSWRKAH